jgi:cytochrome c oxidase subunit 3
MAHTATDDRPPYLGHHYDSVEQQFQSGKLGMWLFLSTEILLFAGLFCAYAVYRRNHPEIFLYAHHFLDTKLGGLNTIVLIFSSLTMAIGVRCAQKGQRGMLIAMLTLTFLCACTFLGVKYIEYNHKWKHGLLWGTLYQNQEAHGGGHDAAAAPGSAAPATHGETPASASPATPADVHATTTVFQDAKAAMEAAKVAWQHVSGGHDEHAVVATTSPAGVEKTGAAVSATPASAAHDAPPSGAAPPTGLVVERSTIPKAAPAPAGLASPTAGVDHAGAPSNVHIFFGIYFVMTGLHGLHVIIGMIVIAWLIVRSYKGHFGPDYFTPVDLGGLYWHIVDLIWIYLFPLLYLIH